MNVLLIYASHYGQTEKIANAIADRLREAGCEVDVWNALANRSLPAPSAHDVVIFGSRIERGSHSGVVTEYIRKYRDILRRMPTAFFSVSMAASTPGAGPDPNGYMTATFDNLDWKPTRSVAFAGGLPYRQYNWFLRAVMKQISRSAKHTTDTTRNHELTDWGAVRNFADEVAALGLAAWHDRCSPSVHETPPSRGPRSDSM